MTTASPYGTTLVFRRPPPPRQGSKPLSVCYTLLAEGSGRWAVVAECPSPKAARHAKRRLLAALAACSLDRAFEIRGADNAVYARVRRPAA